MLTLMLSLIIAASPLDSITPDERAAIIKEYNAQVAAERAKADKKTKVSIRQGSHIPTIRELRLNAVGTLPQDGKFTVVRIIYADMALIETGSDKRQFVVSGIDATQLGGGKATTLRQIYRVTGTMEVDDEEGEMQTTPIIEPFDLRNFLANHHPANQSLKQK